MDPKGAGESPAEEEFALGPSESHMVLEELINGCLQFLWPVSVPCFLFSVSCFLFPVFSSFEKKSLNQALQEGRPCQRLAPCPSSPHSSRSQCYSIRLARIDRRSSAPSLITCLGKKSQIVTILGPPVLPGLIGLSIQRFRAPCRDWRRLLKQAHSRLSLGEVCQVSGSLPRPFQHNPTLANCKPSLGPP